MRAIRGGGNWEEDDCFVDIDNALDPEGAARCGMTFLGVAGRPPVITRSGRAMKPGVKSTLW